MTKEEISPELKAKAEECGTKAYQLANNPYVAVLTHDAFLAGAEYATPKWIKCSERLPPNDEEVLVFYKHLCSSDGQIYDIVEQGRYNEHWVQLQGENVTHWAELPSPPAEESEK